jgi:hypothetical protein
MGFVSVVVVFIAGESSRAIGVGRPRLQFAKAMAF